MISLSAAHPSCIVITMRFGGILATALSAPNFKRKNWHVWSLSTLITIFSFNNFEKSVVKKSELCIHELEHVSLKVVFQCLLKLWSQRIPFLITRDNRNKI